MQRIVILTILIFTFFTSFAVPARPGKTRVKMSDGTWREVIIRGDERCHWTESSDGAILGQKIVNKSLIERGKMSAPKGKNGLRKKEKASTFLLDGSFPTTGKHKLLALLINYVNTTPTYSREHYESMLNGHGYGGVGSFRDYFLTQSFGQLDITTTVTPWITVSQPKQYYNIDNTPELIEEALRQIDPNINLRDYDNDGDGILDGLIVIHAGHGQEASGDATDIWSHSSTIYGMQFDGVSIYRYTIEPELLHDGPSTIGVFCHEFGHNLGALDYYDTNYSADGAYGGTGPWDLMGEGAWNGPDASGTHPAPFTAWQKAQFGWLPEGLPSLNESTRYDAMPPVSQSGIAYRANTTTEGDYFVLENVQPIDPWTQYLPGHGLVVTHVIESILRQRMSLNNVNSTYPQGIYTVCADAHSDPTDGQPSSYGDVTSSATPFPGTRRHTVFSDETLPSTHSQDGRYGYFSLIDIEESDTEATVSFSFVLGDAPQRPLHLTSVVSRGIVNLAWDFPADKEQPVSCSIYRDGTLLTLLRASENETWNYTDNDCNTAGLVTYTVDATYASGLTSAITVTTTRIPQQVASEFVATLSHDDATGKPLVNVSWQIPSEISRCVNDLNYDLVDHFAQSLRYAHRFGADDLRPHVGRQIRSVTFLPQQRSTDASYKICVWRVPSSNDQYPTTVPADNLQLVSERAVTEYSPSYLRTVPFTTRPVIEAGYDYLVGVEITSQNGLAEIVTDQSELQDGFGNIMSLNGGTWMPDPLTTGNYILSVLLTGESEADNSPFTDSYRPYNQDCDLFFPIGFSLYCGDTHIADTANRTLNIPVEDLHAENGTISLSLISTYKGSNESRPVTTTILVEDDGILAPLSPATFDPIYDLSGRRITSSLHSGIVIEGNKKKIVKVESIN